MFIDPRTAIREGWVSGIHDKEKQVQPNAIDFTLERLFTIRHEPFIISEYGKVMRNNTELVPTIDRRQKVTTGEELYFWSINEGAFDGMSDVYVNLPEGVAAMLIIRSTFNRNGLFLTSGLYDSGFKGHLGFILHNRVPGTAKIAKGTRIGQVIFVASESAGMYAGGWNHEQGTHFTESE